MGQDVCGPCRYPRSTRFCLYRRQEERVRHPFGPKPGCGIVTYVLFMFRRRNSLRTVLYKPPRHSLMVYVHIRMYTSPSLPSIPPNQIVSAKPHHENIIALDEEKRRGVPLSNRIFYVIQNDEPHSKVHSKLAPSLSIFNTS